MITTTPQPPLGGPISEEFTLRFATLATWKSTNRLAASIWWWKDHRFPGDESLYTEMESWRKQDRHLYDWFESQALWARNKRDQIYRRFAAIVRRHYRELCLEKINYSVLLAKPGPDDSSDAAIKEYVRVASPGRLVEILKEAVVSVDLKSPVNTTKRCHVCGVVEDFDAAVELVHECKGCGAIWDQDRNAAINLLRGEDGRGVFVVHREVPPRVVDVPRGVGMDVGVVMGE